MLLYIFKEAVQTEQSYTIGRKSQAHLHIPCYIY